MQGPQLAAFANLEPTGAALVMISCLGHCANCFVLLPTKLNIHFTAGSVRYPVRSVPRVQVPLVTLNWPFGRG